MAFNWNTFWTRTWTALVFVAVMLGGLLYSEISFFLLVALIHFGCWYEYPKLIEKIYGNNFHPYIKTGLALTGFHILLLFTHHLSFAGYNVRNSISLIFLISGITMLIIGILKQQPLNLKALGALAAGILYISLSISLLTDLRLSQNVHIIKGDEMLAGHSSGYYLPLFIIIAIWINDTMAYLVGSAIGKTPFSKISPKKTLEGTIGGMLLCILAVTFILKPWFHWQQMLALSLIAAVFGTLGDLLESKIKRMAGVKDSGRIMPGHGGFLDRFDSMLVAVPVIWLFLQIFK